MDREQQVDTYSHITHAVANCTSNELFKNVLDDHAVGAFSGRILVKEGAQKTAAFQTNRNLCATREARMYSKPQLAIYADDVKCSHGMTTGQLDENALFYMRSRGIPLSLSFIHISYADVQQVFKITKVGTVAGCMVKEGKIKRTNKIRLIRDGSVIYAGELGSLKRFKDDVKEVVAGLDCGLNITNFNDIQVGDVIESYEETEIKKTL